MIISKHLKPVLKDERNFQLQNTDVNSRSHTIVREFLEDIRDDNPTFLSDFMAIILKESEESLADIFFDIREFSF